MSLFHLLPSHCLNILKSIFLLIKFLIFCPIYFLLICLHFFSVIQLYPKRYEGSLSEIDLEWDSTADDFFTLNPNLLIELFNQ